MAGRTLRGPANRAIQVKNFGQWKRIFGAADPANPVVGNSVQAFFAEGGRVLYFCRIVGSSGGSNTAASLVLNAQSASAIGQLASAPNAFPAALKDGDTFVGKVNGGANLTVTINAKQASVTGAGATYAAVAAASHLDLVIGGVAQVITFDGTENTQAKYLAAINAVIVGGAAVDAAGQLKIRTDKAGSGASGSVAAATSATVLTSLGLAAGAFTSGGASNVVDSLAVTETELAGLFNATFAGSVTTPDTANHAVTWASSTTGTGSVQLTSGLGVAKISGFDTAVHTANGASVVPVLTATASGPGVDSNRYSVLATAQDTVIASSIPAPISAGTITSLDGLSASIISRIAVGDTLRLQDGASLARGVVSEIRGGTKVVFTAPVTTPALAAATTKIYVETFSLTIFDDGVPARPSMSGLRMSALAGKNYVINQTNTGADDVLVAFSDIGAAFNGGDLRPVVANTSVGDSLTGGTEATVFVDADYVGTKEAKTGIYSMNTVRDVRLAAIPGVYGFTTAGSIKKALRNYCEDRTTVEAVLSSPPGYTPAQTRTFKAEIVGASSFTRWFHQHVIATDVTTGLQNTFPIDGWAMGRFVKTLADAGLKQAPAGDIYGRFSTVDGLSEYLPDIEDDDRDDLYDAYINPVDKLEDGGFVICGSRTGEPGTWGQMHVRQTYIYIRESLRIGLRFALFLVNDASGRARVKRSVDSFYRAMWKRGDLTGASEEEAFQTQVDENNNGNEVVSANIMQVDSNVSVPNTTENINVSVAPAVAKAA
jgi:hypothetical protein